jgi:hypothetical protein
VVKNGRLSQEWKKDFSKSMKRGRTKPEVWLGLWRELTFFRKKPEYFPEYYPNKDTV